MIENKKYNNKVTLLMLVIPLSLLSKIFQFTVLPDKYFWDSQRMLSMLTGSGTMPAWGGSYQIAVNFFEKFNFFNFTTLEEFAYSLAIIFSFVLVFLFVRVRNPSFIETCYYLATIFLLNIYVFNISKDMIQFLIFFLMYLIVIFPNFKPILKLIFIVGLFYWESTFFRPYVIIMGVLFVVAYMLLRFMQLKRIRVTWKNMLYFLLILLSVFTLFILLAQIIMPNEYEELINIRETSVNNLANSQIENWIKSNGTLHIFLINYIINAIRMMIPFELLTKGVSYFPFVIFQVFTLYYLFRAIRNLNYKTKSETIIALSIFIGYLLGSFIFEPDFGSFVRHESATFPILHLLITIPKNKTGGD